MSKTVTQSAGYWYSILSVINDQIPPAGSHIQPTIDLQVTFSLVAGCPRNASISRCKAFKSAKTSWLGAAGALSICDNDEDSDPLRALSILFRSISPLGRCDAPGELPSMLFRPWRCGGGGGGTMDIRLLGVATSALMIDGGLPDMDREEPLAGGGAGKLVVDGEVSW